VEDSTKISGQDTPTKPTSIEFILSDGRTASIRKGKGSDVENASKFMDQGNPGRYLTARISMLSTIGGKPIVPEDLVDLDEDDYDLFVSKWDELKNLK